MHQIDQLGLVLQRLMGKLLGTPDPATTLQSTLDQLTTAVGKAVTDVEGDPRDMLNAIAGNPAFTTTNAEHLAELLWRLGDPAEAPAASPHASRACRERALLILEHLNATDRTYSFERHAKVTEWRRELGG